MLWPYYQEPRVIVAIAIAISAAMANNEISNSLTIITMVTSTTNTVGVPSGVLVCAYTPYELLVPTVLPRLLLLLLLF